MYRLHGNSGASLQDRLIDASATELSSTRWQAGAAEARTARGAASSRRSEMTAMGRDGSTVQNAKLTTGERLMLVGLIACGLLGLFLTLVAAGVIR